MRTHICTDKDPKLLEMALAEGFVADDKCATTKRVVRIDPGFRCPRKHPIID